MPRLPTVDDATPNSGVVVFADSAGDEHSIDFLSTPFGLDRNEVLRTSVEAVPQTESGFVAPARLRVVHPVLLMLSRVKGVITLDDVAAARKKLRASVLCAREFLREMLGEGHVRPVLKLDERIFRFGITALGRVEKCGSPSDPGWDECNDRSSGESSRALLLVPVGFGIMGFGYALDAILTPGRRDYLDLVNEHNRLNPQSPIHIQLGFVPQRGGGVAGVRLSFF